MATLMLNAYAEDHDGEALALIQEEDYAVSRRGNSRGFGEVGVAQSSTRRGGGEDHGARVSLDVRYEGDLAPRWRGVLSDRLDMYTQMSASDSEDAVNTLREAYIDWRPRAERIWGLGRINPRHGVASGYNPTDYFRSDAVRSFVSLDPESLRANRLGSVMLRTQMLWSGGSFAIHYSPRLANAPSAAAYSVDLGATNRTERILLDFTQRWLGDFQPQWTIFHEAGRSPQLGLNATTLLNNSTVGYLEWSGGHSPALRQEAFGQFGAKAFRQRVAAGATYTTAFKLAVTAEYIYNGAGLSASEWNDFVQKDRGGIAPFLAYLQGKLDLPARRNIFLQAAWKDAFIHKLDLTGFIRMSEADHSRQYWAEARYHWDEAEVYLQHQINSGAPGSAYGSLAQRRISSLFVKYFF